MNQLKSIQLLLLIFGFAILFLACQKEAIQEPVDYNKYNSLVGQEGKTIHFFEKSSNIPDGLFPILEIAPNTFNDTAIIQVFYEKIVSGNIPAELTSFSKNNFLWRFKCNKQIIKPITVKIPFSEPDSFQRLDDYKYLFKLYSILPGKDTKIFSNWKLINNCILDTSNNLFSLNIDNFDCSYCVQFEEIKLKDVCILKVNGYINDICRWSVDDFIKIGNGINLLGGFVSNNGTSYYDCTLKSKGVNVCIAFSFIGNSVGTYTGEKVKIKYYYSKDSKGSWINEFSNAFYDTISISRYGEIGNFIEGSIRSRLRNLNKKEIQLNMDFICRRAR